MKLLAGLAVGIVLLPATSWGAPLVYIQLLARESGTTNPFSNLVFPTSVGEEFDWIVVATLAPAGTPNSNLPIDGNGKQEIGSWQYNPDTGIGDGPRSRALFTVSEPHEHHASHVPEFRMAGEYAESIARRDQRRDSKRVGHQLECRQFRKCQFYGRCSNRELHVRRLVRHANSHGNHAVCQWQRHVAEFCRGDRFQWRKSLAAPDQHEQRPNGQCRDRGGERLFGN